MRGELPYQDRRWQPIAPPGARTAELSEIDLSRLDLETVPAPTATAAAQIRVESLARLLGQFEPHRPTGFPLAHIGAIDCVALRRHVIDAQCHEIASRNLVSIARLKRAKSRARISRCNLARMAASVEVLLVGGTNYVGA
jgi:hypothetical protein